MRGTAKHEHDIRGGVSADDLSEFRSGIRSFAKWKPSNSGWRFYQLTDNMLYWMARPFIMASWLAFLCVCLIDFRVSFAPVLVHVVSMCLGFSIFSCASLLFAIFFQLTVPFVFWRGFVDYHVMIAKYRRDDRGMFEMATSLKFLILTLLPCVVLRWVSSFVTNVLSMSMLNVTVASFFQVAAISVIKVGVLATLGVGMFVFVCILLGRFEQLNEKYPDIPIYLYNKRQLANAISSIALSKGEPGDKNECDSNRNQCDFYDAPDDIRTLCVLSSLVTSLFSVVSRDVPNECCSLHQAHELEKALAQSK